MRLLEKFDREDSAQLLSDVLYAANIESTVRPVGESGFSVWVHDDDQMEAARSVFAEFQRSREAPHWPELGRLGQERRRVSEHERTSQRPVIINAREHLERRQRIGIVTLVLIGISVTVAIVTRLGESLSMVRYFAINDFRIEGPNVVFMPGLASVLHGQVWRLVTPIFVHFGIIHLFFNMWWLKDLGTAIEHTYSRLYLSLLVLAVGVLSNLLQYFWAGSPVFGGMSGVVYGLFGFLWLRGRFDPTCPLRVNRSTVMWLMLWYVLCITGMMGPVANAAHTGGVAVGAAWGFLSSGYLGRQLRR
jgi:GlpG protein